MSNARTHHIPIHHPNEESTSNDIANKGWYHAFPDVIANRDIRVAEKDRHGHEKHVRNNVVESQAGKCESGPPDSDYFAEKLSCHHGEEASQTDQPVGSDAAQEDHVPFRRDDFFFVEGEDFRYIRLEIEDPTVAAVYQLAIFLPRMCCVAYPVTRAMTKRLPARLPKKVIAQCMSIFTTPSRRCKTDIVVNMKLPVQRSEPVSTMETRPKGKMIAPIILINPGAFSWYHGAVFVMRSAAQANERRQPAMKELKKILSTRMLALVTPAREQISVVSLGV
jgi:hypothetical protein